MTRPSYKYKTEPQGKQRDVIENTWTERSWAFLCRPGTGKTKISLDTAGLLYKSGAITSLIVIAPEGVHRQWVTEGVPTHLPDDIEWRGGYYDSGVGKRAFAELEIKLRSRAAGLRILAITFDGLQTKRGRELAHALAIAHKSLVVIDESHKVSNTKSVSHREIMRLVYQCPYRRIATGTLLRQNPYSAYGQFEYLGNSLLGFSNLSSFKSMYTEMLPPTHGLVKNIADTFRRKTGRKITPQIAAKDADGRPIYKNLAHLRKRLEKYSSFLTLSDVHGTEPEVRLLTRYVNLTPQQRTMYEELNDLGVTEHAGSIITADMALSTATRLCQITGGFCPTEDDPNATPVAGENPKMNELVDIIGELGDEPVVIWCKFTAEIVAVVAMLRDRYGEASAVRYDGTCNANQKTESKQAFIAGTARYFVGQIKAGGTGLDGLQRVAKYMVFYSNDYSYVDREQAVARLARTAGSPLVVVTDIMAQDSVDADVVRCMQTAQDVHEKVLVTRMTGKVNP